MQARQLGKSSLSITPIGFGSWAIGGSGYQFAWGSQDDNESVAAIQRALDLGVNWIDTAAVYGLGHSEEIVARAIKGRSPRPYVFTKCERVWDEQGRITGSLKKDSLRRELEASLKRLQTDVIDLYQVHWPEPDADVEEGIGALAEFQREGKIRFIGVSNFNVGQLRRALSVAQITSLQPPYSLLRRDIEQEILPFCAQQQIGGIAYSPMASGLLTGRMTRERIARLPEDDWRKHSPQFQEPQLSQALELVERLREMGQRHGRSPAEVAIAWTLRRPEVTGAIVGARRPEQVNGVIGAADFRLSEDEIAELEKRGSLSYGD